MIEAPGTRPGEQEALSDEELNALPMSQSLVLEVLAARQRLGEVWWSLHLSRGLKPVLVALESRGLIRWRSHVVPRTVYASLTDKGAASVYGPTYVPPIVSAVREATLDEVITVISPLTGWDVAHEILPAVHALRDQKGTDHD